MEEPEPEPEPEVVWTPEPVSEPTARAEPTSGFWAKVREATAVDAGAAEPIPTSVGTPEPETDSEAEEVERVRANLRRRGLPRLDALPHRPEPKEFEPVEP